MIKEKSKDIGPVDQICGRKNCAFDEKLALAKKKSFGEPIAESISVSWVLYNGLKSEQLEQKTKKERKKERERERERENPT